MQAEAETSVQQLPKAPVGSRVPEYIAGGGMMAAGRPTGRSGGAAVLMAAQTN